MQRYPRKFQHNFRASKIAQLQIEQLTEVLGISKTELLTLAIDRLWRDFKNEPELPSDYGLVHDDGKVEFPY